MATSLIMCRVDDSTMQGRIQDFFRRGCTRLLLYFNTNKYKPQSVFFLLLRNTSCIRKPQVTSGGGTPCTLPLDPPLRCIVVFISETVLVEIREVNFILCQSF